MTYRSNKGTLKVFDVFLRFWYLLILGKLFLPVIPTRYSPLETNLFLSEILSKLNGRRGKWNSQRRLFSSTPFSLFALRSTGRVNVFHDRSFNAEWSSPSGGSFYELINGTFKNLSKTSFVPTFTIDSPRKALSPLEMEGGTLAKIWVAV